MKVALTFVIEIKSSSKTRKATGSEVAREPFSKEDAHGLLSLIRTVLSLLSLL